MNLKIASGFLSVICALSLAFVLLISSFGMAAFYDIDFFRYEFEKNGADIATGFSIDRLEEEAQLLVDYMVLDEAEEEFQNSTFFNEREKMHMEDVKKIVQKAIILRRLCTVLIILSIAVIIFLKLNKRFFIKVFMVFFAGLGALFYFIVAASVINFNKIFTIFHEVFFNNDLWLLDPKESLMINMLPEIFFIDAFARICIIFGVLWLIILVFCFFINRKLRHDGAGD